MELYTYKIKDSFENYIKKRRTYPSSFFGLKGKRRFVDYYLYKKIIKEYFTVYLKDFYYSSSDLYFPMSGMLKKTFCAPKVRVQQNKTYRESNGFIGFLWYRKRNVIGIYKLNKLVGTSGLINKLEKDFKESFDINLLPNFDKVINDMVKNDILYINKYE